MEVLNRVAADYKYIHTLLESFPFDSEGAIGWDIATDMFRILPPQPDPIEPQDHIYNTWLINDNTFDFVP